MSATPTSPAAGWYPAPNGSSSMWYWDGARWTAPDSEGGSDAVALGRIAKLSAATRVLLITCAVLAVVTIGVEAFGLSAMTVYLNGPASAGVLLDTYDLMTLVVSILSAIALVATGIFWLLWQYRAAVQVRGRTRRSPGWHVASWIVPVICVWFPYQNIADLWRAVGRRRPTWQIVWWAAWLLNGLVIQVASRLFLIAQDFDQLRIAMSITIAGELLMLIAVPLAWLIVRDITEGVRRGSPA